MIDQRNVDKLVVVRSEDGACIIIIIITENYFISVSYDFCKILEILETMIL